jgi:hypothetical protein
MELTFPKEDSKKRKLKAQAFEKSLEDYHKTLQQAETKLIESHHALEADL